MKMTKEHFEAIAEVLKETRPAVEPRHTQWLVMVAAFGDLGERSNPHFNRARFYRACGLEG